MLAPLLVFLTFVASGFVLRGKRDKLAGSYKKLSPAVPDRKAIEGAPYRGAEEEMESFTAPLARKSLELLPETRALEKVQKIGSWIAPGAAAAILARWPLAALGPWSALLGGVWGLLAAQSLLEDDRRKLGAVALALLPLSFFSVWGAAGLLFVYGGARMILDQKDSAAMDEAERERLADPRYLVGSTERRAGRVSLGGGGVSDITAASARDNSKA